MQIFQGNIITDAGSCDVYKQIVRIKKAILYLTLS